MNGYESYRMDLVLLEYSMNIILLYESNSKYDLNVLKN